MSTTPPPANPSTERAIGELAGELKALTASMAAVWAKLDEMSKYNHQRSHDLVNQTTANTSGIVLINARLDTLTARTDKLATDLEPLTKLATRGEGAIWATLKIAALATFIASLAAGLLELSRRILPPAPPPH